jgi:hypothetical protein
LTETEALDAVDGRGAGTSRGRVKMA